MYCWVNICRYLHLLEHHLDLRHHHPTLHLLVVCTVSHKMTNHIKIVKRFNLPINFMCDFLSNVENKYMNKFY